MCRKGPSVSAGGCRLREKKGETKVTRFKGKGPGDRRDAGVDVNLGVEA